MILSLLDHSSIVRVREDDSLGLTEALRARGHRTVGHYHERRGDQERAREEFTTSIDLALFHNQYSDVSTFETVQFVGSFPQEIEFDNKRDVTTQGLEVVFDWHPLVSGDPESIHRAGISVRDRVISEEYVHPDELPEHLVHWFD